MESKDYYLLKEVFVMKKHVENLLKNKTLDKLTKLLVHLEEVYPELTGEAKELDECIDELIDYFTVDLEGAVTEDEAQQMFGELIKELDSRETES
jgi:hypothetical protein